MYIFPEFFVGAIIGFIILLFAHLFAMYLLERTNPDKEYDLEFRFPLRFPFKIVSKEKETPKSEKTLIYPTTSDPDTRITIQDKPRFNNTQQPIDKHIETKKRIDDEIMVSYIRLNNGEVYILNSTI
jgi:hypothetical protein